MDVNFVFTIIILIFSVVVHELSHGYTADYLGDPTPSMQGRLTLNPLKHLDPIGSFLLPVLTYNVGGFIFGWAKPVEFNPYNLRNQRWGEAIIAIAGPASNIAIATLFGTIARFADVLNLGDRAVALCVIVVLVNVSLAVFNMMPIPPLDGSKILFAFLPQKFRHVREHIERYGLVIFVAFILVGGSVLIPLIRGLSGLILGA